MRKLVFIIVLASFILSVFNIPTLKASEIVLPSPGTMVHLSPSFQPPILKGIKVHPDNPFKFEFVLSQGDNASAVAEHESNSAKADFLKQESTKLIKYFLAALTTPEKDMWVNLSPYEKDRIVPDGFGQTEMGRDLLAQDYILKQITASLVYPEGEIGKTFWKRIYEATANKNVPVNTFNKVWIVPAKAVVYENPASGTAYVVESSLKVLTEQDYLANTKNNNQQNNNQIVRDIIIPQLTKEINEGKNFAQLRQVYNSLILATWYKKKIRDSILSQVYADKNKVAGINIDDPLEKQKIYDQYLQAFKKGAYNFIKVEQDPLTQQMMPRKYFSGGMHMNMDMMSTVHVMPNSFTDSNQAMLVQVSIAPEGARVNEAIDQPKDPKVLALTDSINASIHEKGILEMQSIDYDDPLYVQVRNIIAVANNHEFHAGDEYRSGMAEAVYRVVQYLKSRNDLMKLDFEQIARFLLLKRVMIAGKLAEKGNSDEIDLISGVGDSDGWRVRSLGRFGSPQSISFASSKGYPELYQKLMRKKNEFELSKNGILTYRKTYRFGATRTKYDQIIEVDNDFLEFKIYHADPNSVPLILFHLQDLWTEILSNSNLDKRDRLIAEMEWWFYQANPYIRAGASIGNALSLIAQSLTGKILDDHFEHHDWDALSSTLEEYILNRSNQFHQLRQIQAASNPATKTGKTADNAQLAQDAAMHHTESVPDLSQFKVGISNDRISLFNQGKTYESLSREGRSHIFIYGNYVIRVRPNTEQMFLNLQSIVAAFNLGNQIGIPIPSVRASGYINGEDGKVYSAIVVDRIEGFSLDSSSIKMVNQEDRVRYTELYIELLRAMLKNHVVLGDWQAAQFMIGYNVNDPQKNIKAWLVDPKSMYVDENKRNRAIVYYQNIFSQDFVEVNEYLDLRLIEEFLLTESGVHRSRFESIRDSAAAARGGIDFNADKINLETNVGEGIKFHVDPAMFKQLQDAPGFTPVIIDIQPMTDLPKFLGLKVSNLP